MRDHLGEFYDKTSDFQQEQFNTLCRLINTTLPDRSNIKNLIDIGSGTGARTAQCFNIFPALERIAAFEPDHDMIEVARTKYSDPRIRYFPAPAAGVSQAKELSASFDFILSNWSVHWVPDKEKMLHDIAALTRPGAHIAFSTCERLPSILTMIDAYVRAEFMVPAEKTPYFYLDKNQWVELMTRHGWEIRDIRAFSVDREVDSAEHYLMSWFAASTTKFMHGKHLIEMNRLSLSDLVWMMNRAFPSKRHQNGIAFSEDVLFFVARRK